jgi:arylsulfatase A-like enzyme
MVAGGSSMTDQTPFEPRGSRPNIILVMSDDQGWGDTGYNGNTVLKTPSLDAMAAEGVRFDRFYAAAPVCSPTRGSCMTGRHPYRYGIFWADTGHLPAEEITIAEALKTAGYATGHFGKWHIGTLTKTEKDSTRGGPENPEHYSPPWDNGFDECFSTESWMPTYNPMVWGGGKWTPVADGLKFKDFIHIMDRPVDEGETPATHDVFPWHGSYWRGPGERVTEGLVGDDSKIVMDRALDFIDRKAAGTDPFLAIVWFHTPHTPLVAGHRHRKPYEDQPIRAQHWFGAVTAMDEQIGRLRGRLSELGIEQNTLVWFCSDNGPSYIHDFNSAGPFKGKKGTIYEGGVRVPGLLQWPAAIPIPKVIDTPCVTSDFYPTLLSLAGVELPEQPVLDGIDLTPILLEAETDRPEPVAFQSPVRGRGIGATDERQLALSDNRYKLLSFTDGKSYELYDLDEDPSETTDIAAEHPELVAEMRERLERWCESCRASLRGEDY